MKQILILIAFFAAFTANAQIVAWGPGTWVWTNGAPAHNPGQSGSKYAIDTVTFKMYEWTGTGTTWTFSGWRIQNISGCASPAFTPGKHDSQFVINGCDSLYYYRGGVWRHINAGGSGGGSGTITQFNFTDANGFDGTVTNATTTPTLSLATTVTGILQGSGGALSAVTVGDGLTFSSGTISAVDQSATNEIQTLSYSAPNISLSSGGGSVSLPLVAVVEGYGVDISGTTTRTVTVDTAQIATLYDVSQATQTVSAGTGISVSQLGQNYTVTNTGDLSATNELNTAFTVTGDNLRITDAGGNIDVPVTDIAPVQAVNAVQGLSKYGDDIRFGMSWDGTGPVPVLTDSNSVYTYGNDSDNVGMDMYNDANISYNTKAYFFADYYEDLNTLLQETAISDPVTVNNSVHGFGTGFYYITGYQPATDRTHNIYFSNNGNEVKSGMQSLSAYSKVSTFDTITNLTSSIPDKTTVFSVKPYSITSNKTIEYESNYELQPLSLIYKQWALDSLLSTVSTDATLTGNGSSGTPLGVVFPILAPDGSGAAPSYSFSSDDETGMFYDITTGLSFTSNEGIPITTAAGDNAGGDGGSIIAESGDGTFQGGGYTVTGGSATSAGGTGGAITINAGTATTGTGGLFEMSAGIGDIGGGFFMTAGDATGTNQYGGGFTMTSGDNPNGLGGNFTMNAGNGTYGGNFLMSAGDATVEDETAGSFYITGGDASGENSGAGDVNITGGIGATSTNPGGGVVLRGGVSPSGGGSVNIFGGQTTLSGKGGSIALSGGNGTTGKGKVSITSSEFVFGIFTTTARDALTGVTNGTVIYNSTTNNIQAYLSGTWQDLYNTGGYQTLTGISPSNITVNQDDYNPGSLSTAGVIYVSSSDIFQIRGLSGGSDGIVRTFVNTGSFPIVFPMDNAGSTAANRFTGGSDAILYPGKPLSWVYHGSANRWRLISPAADEDYSYSRIIHRSFRSGSNTAGDWGDITFTTSGTGAAIAAGTATNNNPFSYWQAQSGTTTTGLAGVGFAKTVSNAWNGTTYRKSRAMVLLPVLSDATNTYQAAFREVQTLATTTASPNNSAGIRYSHGTNSGKWECYTRNNAGSETTLDTGVTVAANTVYSLEIVVDKAGSEYRYYIDGAYIGAITTTTPNTAVEVVSHALINKSAGTTNTSLHVLGGSQLQLN